MTALQFKVKYLRSRHRLQLSDIGCNCKDKKKKMVVGGGVIPFNVKYKTFTLLKIVDSNTSYKGLVLLQFGKRLLWYLLPPILLAPEKKRELIND